MPYILFLFAPHINEELCQVKPLPVAGNFIKFYEPYFYFLVTGSNFAKTPAEFGGYQPGIFQRHIQKSV